MRTTASASLRLTLTVVLAAAVFVTATNVALAGSGREVLDDLLASASPDYGARSGEVAPLREEFLRELLGLPAADRPVLPTSAPLGGLGAGPGAAQPTASGEEVPGIRVVHDPDNDDFAESYAVAGEELPFRATTTPSGSTREDSEPGDCAPTGGSLWYSITSEGGAGLVATLNGGTRPALAVFEGDSVDDLTLVGCHRPLTGAARVGFQPQAGTTYHFQVVASGAESVFELGRLGDLVLATRPVEGGEPGRHKWIPRMSKNGRFIVYSTYAQMVPEDDNDLLDFYLVDTETFEQRLVTVAADGGSADADATGAWAAVSDDGRWVAFQSPATNLVDEPDTNNHEDAFLRDMVEGVTIRLTHRWDGGEARLAEPTPTNVWIASMAYCRALEEVAEAGGPGGGCTYHHPAEITPDGRYVLFATPLRDIVADMPPPEYPIAGRGSGVVQDWQVYRYDRLAGEVTLVNTDADGRPRLSASFEASISDDGRWVAFSQYLEDPFPEDRNAILLKDLVTGQLRLVSRAHGTDRNGDGSSYRPHITGDGRYVVFSSEADDLLAPDHPIVDDNGLVDAYVWDRTTGEMDIASISGHGDNQRLVGMGNNTTATHVFVSDDGRYVTFSTTGLTSFEEQNRSSLTDDDVCSPLQRVEQLYRRDRLAGTTTLLTMASDGTTNGCSIASGGISRDGGRSIFLSTQPQWEDTDGYDGQSTGGVYMFTDVGWEPSG